MIAAKDVRGEGGGWQGGGKGVSPSMICSSLMDQCCSGLDARCDGFACATTTWMCEKDFSPQHSVSWATIAGLCPCDDDIECCMLVP